MPDDETHEAQDEEHLNGNDDDNVNGNEAENNVPKLFNHCLRLYKLLEDRAVGDEGNKIYVGSISPLVVSLGISSSYQSKIVSRLKEMGCIAMLKRGSGAVAKSIWGLYKTPSIEDFYSSDNTGDIGWRREKEKYDEHTQRIKDLNRRITAIEDFMREKGMIV